MGDFKMTFAVTLDDHRFTKPIVHHASFFLLEDEIIKADLGNVDNIRNTNSGNYSNMQTKNIDDLLNGNGGNWADLMNQNVDDTVRNMFRELIHMKRLEDISDNLIDLGDMSSIPPKWLEDNSMIDIPDGIVGESLANLIERFKTSHADQNEIFVESHMVL